MYELDENDIGFNSYYFILLLTNDFILIRIKCILDMILEFLGVLLVLIDF